MKILPFCACRAPQHGATPVRGRGLNFRVEHGRFRYMFELCSLHKPVVETELLEDSGRFFGESASGRTSQKAPF